MLDRYADLFIIGGMTISPFCDPWIGVLAIVGVIFASYMGTQAQAVGVKRDYSGLLGRSDRLVLLIFVPLIQMFLEMARLLPATHHFPVTAAGVTVNLSVIEIMMVWFAIAGNATAIQRASSTWKELTKRETEPAPGTDPEGNPPSAPSSIEDTEAQVDAGKLDLSEATSNLRSARLAIERDMRDLKEKEIRLVKLEKRIERRKMEAGPK